MMVNYHPVSFRAVVVIVWLLVSVAAADARAARGASVCSPTPPHLGRLAVEVPRCDCEHTSEKIMAANYFTCLEGAVSVPLGERYGPPRWQHDSCSGTCRQCPWKGSGPKRGADITFWLVISGKKSQ